MSLMYMYLSCQTLSFPPLTHIKKGKGRRRQTPLVGCRHRLIKSLSRQQQHTWKLASGAIKTSIAEE